MRDREDQNSHEGKRGDGVVPQFGFSHPWMHFRDQRDREDHDIGEQVYRQKQTELLLVKKGLRLAEQRLLLDPSPVVYKRSTIISFAVPVTERTIHQTCTLGASRVPTIPNGRAKIRAATETMKLHVPRSCGNHFISVFLLPGLCLYHLWDEPRHSLRNARLRVGPQDA
jgi:hypothetical protein